MNKDIPTIDSLLAEGFPSFSPELRDDIAGNAQIMHIVEGDMLVDINQFIKYVPLLISGKIKIIREDEAGHELFLYFLNPGEVCAISLVCSVKESISKIKALAMEDSVLVAFPLKFMDEWMQRHKTWYHFVLDTYHTRFEDVLQTLDDIAFHNLDERLVSYLRKTSKAFDSSILHISHQDIALELNSSREVISRLLKKLEQRGRLKVGRGKIELISLD